MATARNLPSQFEFNCLSFPDILIPHHVDHDTISGRPHTLKSDTDTEWKDYVPVNCISDEAYAFLAAYEARMTLRVPVKDDCKSLDTRDLDTLKMYDPERILPNSAPPKRFFRTFWRSITLRMLDLAYEQPKVDE